MNKRLRNIIFSALVLLFLVAVPATILYCIGWRMDWPNKKLVKPGAFYAKILPKSADIYVNGKLSKKTSMLFGTAFVDDLLPKKYDFEIKKDGFCDWKKSLEIKEGLATEAPEIVLFPSKINYQNLSQNIDDFYFFPDNKKILLKESGINSSNKDNWSLKIFDTEKNSETLLIQKSDISDDKVDLLSVQFSQDSKKIFIQTGRKESVYNYILDADKTSELNSLSYFPESDAENVNFDPENSGILFFLKNNKLFEADLESKKINLAVKEDILDYYIDGRDIYYIDQNGSAFKNSLSFDSEKKMNETQILIEKETETKIIAKNSDIFILNNGSFYWLENGATAFKKIFSGMENFKISPKGDRIIFFNDSEIWKAEISKEILQKTGKKEFVSIIIDRFSNKISDIFWYDNGHLIINSGDNLMGLETDERDATNTCDLANYKNPKFFWNPRDRKIYILSGENLFSSDKISQ